MGYVLIRPAPEVDEYVIWCTGSEMPVAYGGRAEIREDALYLEPHRDDIDERLARADLNGSSMIPYPFGYYDDQVFIYRQSGFLAREDLVRACRLQIEDRGEEVAALLHPFPDDD